MKRNSQWQRKCMISAAVLILVSMLSAVLFQMGIRAENILMIYIFGVLIIILETREYVYGITASIVMVAVFNYLFTDPRFTFRVNDQNYLVSLGIFLVVALIVTSLVIKIQRQMEELENNQKITDTLYHISRGYLHVSGIRQVIRYGLECLEEIEQREYIIFISDPKTGEYIPQTNTDKEIPEDVSQGAGWCFRQSMPCGKGTEDFGQVPYYMIPIVSKGITYGVLAADSKSRPIRDTDRRVLEAVLAIIAVAVDREYAEEAEQESRLKSEREHLRNNLLRSISHDLRTPLAGITGSASFLLESWGDIDGGSRDTLLRDVVNDSAWLGRLVENLLNMTRIQEGQLTLKYTREVADDIAGEVMQRVASRMGSRQLEVVKPEECLEIPMDGQLIMQVIVNLIDNAIKHTDETEGKIRLLIETKTIREKQKEEYVQFSVEDNGSGIDPKIQDKMFDSFVTIDTRKSDSGRGIGLGLNIASEIVRAHHGMIGSHNNETKGATVFFLLPLHRGEKDE